MKMDKSKRDTSGQVKNGVFKGYFKHGKLSCIGKYRRGEKTGEWKYYLRNASLKVIGKCANGKMKGL